MPGWEFQIENTVSNLAKVCELDYSERPKPSQG
jgi:hypothetical protein